MCTEQDTSVVILYESKDYLVLDKPYDLVINSDDTNEKDTLLNRVLQYDALRQEVGVSKYHFVHRLDYATSGVICLAKSSAAAGAAGKLFQRRAVHKYYLAVVRGHVKDTAITVDAHVGYKTSHLEDNKMMTCDLQECVGARSACTRMLLLARGTYQGQPVSKLLLKPITGRRHQLRVHCHLLGHTILGDYTYSDRQDANTDRMFLHAHRLELPLPDEKINVKTEDPFTSRTCPGLQVEELEGSAGDAFNFISDSHFEKQCHYVYQNENK